MTRDSQTIPSPSHSSESVPAGEVHKQIVLRCSPERAFELFTESMGQWWPLRTHSVYGDEAVDVTVGRAEGEKIVETTADGRRSTWGTITAFDAGRRIAFTWHPGMPDAHATHVEVIFRSAGGGTIVDLRHTGWDNRTAPEQARAGYETGWPFVLGRLVELADAAG